MTMHDSGRISRRTVSGLAPHCRMCGEEFEALELVRPVVRAGPLCLYACPACRKLSFREDASERAPEPVLAAWADEPARPARRIGPARHVRSVVEAWLQRAA